MASLSKLLELSTSLTVSPALIEQQSYDILDSVLEGEFDIPETTNPWTWLLECSATHSAAAMNKMEVLSRRMYKQLAVTFDDLYPHMSDSDYAGLLVTPSRTSIFYIISAEDVRRLAVTDPVSNKDKLVIPRDTIFSVDGLDFYMHYPLNIIVLQNGEFHVYLDQEFTTPIDNSIGSNVLSHQKRNYGGIESLIIEIPVEQLSMDYVISPLIGTSGFKTTNKFNDQLHYVRAFQTDDNVTWQELSVTFSDRVYDVNKPTLVVQVFDGYYVARIPVVYFTKGLIKGKLQILTFTSKGKLEKRLGDFSEKDWSIQYRDINNLTTMFTQPLVEVTSASVVSDNYTDGGLNARTVDEMRDIVMYERDNNGVAITDAELEISLKKRGYGYSRQKDTISNRTYVANKKLPTPNISRISSAIGVANRRVVVDDLRTDLPNTMLVNGDRITLRPTSLFKESEGVTNVISDNEFTRITALSNNDLVDEINNGGYYYSPFYYVLDSSEPIFTSRAYYLSEPKYLSRSYVDSNVELGFIIATRDIKVTLDNLSYKLVVTADIPPGLTAATLQMGFSDSVHGRVHMNNIGVLTSAKTMEFTFTLTTNLDLDKNHTVVVNGFLKNDLTAIASRLNLTQELDFFYITNTAVGYTSNFDAFVTTGGLIGTTSNVSYEKVKVSLGEHMEGLYVKTRPILRAPEFERHTTSKVKTWPEDVYAKDASGRIYNILPNGTVQFIKVHKKDDPVLINGKEEYLYRVNDIVYDSVSNQPVVLVDTAINREIQMTLLDAKYLFSTTDDVVEYRKEIPTRIIDWIKHDILTYRPNLIERTHLYFEPKTTAQTVLVSLDAGRDVNMNTSLKFAVRVVMNPANINDKQLQDNLKTVIKNSIIEGISGNKLSMATLYKIVMNMVGDEVYDINISNPIPGGTGAVLKDTSASFTLGSELRPLPNGLYDIVDSIEFTFVKGVKGNTSLV